MIPVIFLAVASGFMMENVRSIAISTGPHGGCFFYGLRRVIAFARLRSKATPLHAVVDYKTLAGKGD
jgi:hypothetical protein